MNIIEMKGDKLEQIAEYGIHSESRIKLIGDSTAAGRGSSDCDFQGDFFLKYDGRKYYRQSGEKCWASIVKKYVEEKYPGCRFYNNGCTSMNSHRIHKYIHSIFHLEDTMIIMMLGATNRDINAGMALLRNNVKRIIRLAQVREVPIILISPGPATDAEERLGKRKYHMKDVDMVLREVAWEQDIPFISMYEYLLEYSHIHDLTLEEMLRPEEEFERVYRKNLPEREELYSSKDWNRITNGLNPPDSIQKVMAEHIIDCMKW